MPSPNLTELIVALYRRLHHRDPDSSVVQAIEQAREDNGLDQDDQVPSWLIDSFTAVLANHEVKNELFPQIGSDIASFFEEVASVIPGWKHHDEGEWVLMDFPAIHAQLYLSREARTPEGGSCSSYSVRLSPT